MSTINHFDVRAQGWSVGSLGHLQIRADAAVAEAVQAAADYFGGRGGNSLIALSQTAVAGQLAQTGGRGFSGAMLGFVSDPTALMSQLPLQSHAAQLAQAVLSPQTQQALEALRLGGLPQPAPQALVEHLGRLTAAVAGQLPAPTLGQQMMAVLGMSPKLLDDVGGIALQGVFDQAARSALGQRFVDRVGGQRPGDVARDVLGRIAPNYFKDYDPRTLELMSRRMLTPFGNDIVNTLRSYHPLAIGQQLLDQVTGPLRRELGQSVLGALPESVRGNLGQTLLQAMQGNPLQVGESLLRSIGQKELARLGGDLFGKLPGLKDIGPQDLAGRLAGALFQKGNVAENLFGAVKDFGISKLKDFGQGLLDKYVTPTLKEWGGKALDWAKDKLGSLGKGLLDKIGGGLLDKLGSVGKIASSALSILDGKLDTAKLLKLGINAIPIVGQVVGVLGMIPGVGKYIDKAIGWVAGVLNKIPVVGDILKGVTGAINFVGKGVKKVVGWVGDGIKKVGEAIGDGVKAVGKAIGSAAKSVWNTIKKY